MILCFFHKYRQNTYLFRVSLIFFKNMFLIYLDTNGFIIIMITGQLKEKCLT